ncbi:MAG: pilus assembly protein [Planctomycetaceae bacterium]|nr:pilus assembly protein [Planctomycetaceae bacterium]
MRAVAKTLILRHTISRSDMKPPILPKRESGRLHGISVEQEMKIVDRQRRSSAFARQQARKEVQMSPGPYISPERGANRRGAILSMELVLVLPIFLLLVFAIVEFSMLMSARTRIGDAARQGSRMLCLTGQQPDHIRDHVTRMLGPKLASGCQIEVIPAPYAGGIGNVHIRLPMNNAAPDLLWLTGFSVKGRFIEADAPMVMEQQVASEQIERF